MEERGSMISMMPAAGKGERGKRGKEGREGKRDEKRKLEQVYIKPPFIPFLFKVESYCPVAVIFTLEVIEIIIYLCN